MSKVERKKRLKFWHRLLAGTALAGLSASAIYQLLTSRPTYPIDIYPDHIDFEPLETDPTLVTGRLWFRSDLKRFVYSPDGLTSKIIPKDHIELENVLPNQHHVKVHALSHTDHSDVNITNPTDGQLLVYNAVNNEWTNLDPNVSIVREGIQKEISVSASAAGATPILTPATGKALRILGWNLCVDANVVCEIRFATSKDVIVGIPTKGVNAMNVVGLEAPQGAIDESVEVYVSGAANVKGWIVYEEV